MNKLHSEVLSEIKKHSGQGTRHSWNDKYLGSGHIYYNLSNPIKREIVKDFIRKHKNLPPEEFTKLLDSLYSGKSYEEKTTAGYLLYYLPKLRKQIQPGLLDKWVANLQGWAEIDSTCQSNFTALEILERWNGWQRLLNKLSQDKNLNKKRAALVLLTGVVSKSSDPKLSKLAFQLIERLKSEKSVLITKAISWLLRDLLKLNIKQVKIYLNENLDSLPKIAIRDTKRKLQTGKK